MRILFGLTLLLSIASCQQPAATTSSINDLYNAVSKTRYAINDSMKIYVDQLDLQTRQQPAVYQAMSAIASGLYYSRISNYPQSLIQYQQALRLLQGSGVDSLLGRAYNGIGAAYRNMSQYPLAIEHYQQALSYFEKTGFNEGIAGVNSNLALTYQMKGDSSTAKRHLIRGMEAVKDNKSSRAYLNLLHLTANALSYAGELDSALVLDNEGIAVAASMKLPMLMSPFLDNKANCFVKLGRSDSARLYFAQSKSIDSSIGNTRQVADTYLSLGRLEAKDRHNEAAISHLKQSIALSQQARYKHGERDAWKELSKLYEAKADYTRALEAQGKFAVLHDSIINESTEQRIAELQTSFETQKKEQQIQTQAVKLSQQRKLIGVIGIAAILALLTAHAFYRRRQIRKQAEHNAMLLQQQQQATMQILTAEEKERQRIAVDLHDGIGQTMTAAWLNLQALGERLPHSSEESQLINKTTALVGNSCAEIRQVSHNMMPNALQRKGLVNALKEFTSQLDDKIISVHLQADEEKLVLDPTTELILYRVIQECLNNVVRHAHATELDISIVGADDGVDVLIEDNGIGFSPATGAVSRGIGIHNVRSRVQYLNGTVEWDNTGSGTVVAIHIPYANG